MSHQACITPFQWRHNKRYGVLIHQPHDCLLNRLFRRRSKKTSMPRVPGFGEENSPASPPHKWPVTQKIFPFHDIIMVKWSLDISFQHRDFFNIFSGHAFRYAHGWYDMTGSQFISINSCFWNLHHVNSTFIGLFNLRWHIHIRVPIYFKIILTGKRISAWLSNYIHVKQWGCN